jgi:predicted ribosomally synthesized peptide with nif11-like leader
MSTESLDSFAAKLKSDSDFQNQISQCADVGSVLKIAKDAGFDLSEEDIKSLSKAQLTDDELSGISGGSYMSTLEQAPSVGQTVLDTME